MDNWVSLHNHSHYSLLDGLASPVELTNRAVELGMLSLALTDHGNLFGVIDFYTACKERGIKPIIGYEAYVAPISRHDKAAKKGDITAFHLTLLCKNETGYKNLIQLATKAYTEGFYYKPRIDIELLKQHREGLICLSGCIYSPLNRAFLNQEYQKSSDWALALYGIFNNNDFYIEAQDQGIPEQLLIKEQCKKSSYPIVATNDVHYIKQEDAKAHDALLCIGTGTHIYDPKRLKFPTDQLYMKSREEMEKLFPEEWLDNTLEIADKCNLEIPLHRTTHIYNPEKAFKQLKEECDEYIKGKTTAYQERYQIELRAIEKTGYAEYLLVVADFMRFAHLNNIPTGSGRGSSAGSLVCYLLGITKIDPLYYGLLFERFINIERIEPPDVDVDISQARRQEVIEYVRNEYGIDRVSQITAFGSMKSKLVIKDVCRILQLPYGIGDNICKMIPEPFEGNIEDIIRNIDINDYLLGCAAPELINDLFTIARKIEGRLRHSSTHAAGLVISDKPLTDTVPLYTKNDITLTQYDMYSIEKLGLLKFDILGLRTLDVIYEACEYININPDNICLDDFYTYSQIRQGETFGIFQYEGWGYTKFIKRMQPRNFNDLIALGALYRPGPIASGMADEYIEAMNLKQTSHPSHLDGITDDTHGIYLYQEQIMQAAVKYAGFTMNEADVLRKAMGKKDEKLMLSTLDILKLKLILKGHDHAFTEDLIQKIAKFVRYGWNKAHAVSYALLSYQTAYLKFNYPTAFFCALLNSELDDNERIQRIIAEACLYKVKISPPNINISDAKFKLNNNTIYGGFLALKGIGIKACEAILEERKNSNFKGAQDLRKRIAPKKLNSAMMLVLVNAGVFNGNING